MLKNLTVGKKISLGFAVVLVMLLFIGIASFIGVRGMRRNVYSVIEKNEIAANLAQKEIDHLNWVNKVSEVLLDGDTKSIDVETNPQNCGFGKWYYGDGRKEALDHMPTLLQFMTEIETPHKKLHASVVELEKILSSSENARSVSFEYFTGSWIHLCRTFWWNARRS